ncbi:MAG: HigA family addiction module antidote protein [Verrucomicrobia bacterium]|nr:HigA family addiction module antidote protein [Verrucomicrobiota bacterium]
MPTKIPLGPAANTPGEILLTEFLEPLGLSQNELATRIGLPRMRISEIVRGRRKITAETAIALGQAFAIEPQFWLNLQRDYDLAVEAKKRQSLGARAGKIIRAVSASVSGVVRVSAIPEGVCGSDGPTRRKEKSLEELVSDTLAGKPVGLEVSDAKPGKTSRTTKDRATGIYKTARETSGVFKTTKEASGMIRTTVKDKAGSGKSKVKRTQK